jgi:hypothetical protein
VTIVSAMDRAWTDNMSAVAMFLVFMSMIVSPLISNQSGLYHFDTIVDLIGLELKIVEV